MELQLSQLVILIIAGLLAGGINTLAGGGSNLTLPALMLIGLPPDIANGTNRIAVTLQCLVAVKGFDKHQTLDRAALLPILIPNMLGGLAGAITAALIPGLYLKPLLLGTIIGMSVLILVRPSIVAPPPGTIPLSPREHKGAWWSLFAAGVYGGFVQAGVGFILLAALAGALRYDLLRANALKTACTLAFTAIALAVFIYFDQVWWIPGLALAVGSMLGAHLAVKVAVNVPQSYLKWFLFAMTLCACIAAFVY